ncbi:MAG: Ig-like domain-containing protein, partial [Acidobacteria bacterium]|nr:Ig-like domain-containing protein [Acidobacteriota bacterium]
MRKIATLLLTALAVVAPAAWAQLDDTCVVSALNRSARVGADGSWVLPNVPTNVGRVRIRATCVEDGVTRSGQSGFVAVPTNGVLRVADIVFDAPVLVPSSLALSAPSTLLTTTGATLQLTATVTRPDGSTEDVTASLAGTTYTTSSAALISVDADGLVTALASGNVLITATHEGTLAVLMVRALVSADSDADGLPDDYEVAHGLDPNNPADALGDPDRDGLSVIDEFLAGLDPFDPDSDADGLLDGEEVNSTGTDPLRFDTDGDGVSDGLEVQVGSDPLDPLSVDLAGLLIGIEAAPAADFTLVFDTAIGEASRQLVVTGTLIDGRSLDITDSLYGTTYSSSDLLIVSFGLDDGRVFAGGDGVATVTVANEGLEVSRQVTVETFAPQAISFVPIPGFANAVALGPPGDFHVFVAAGQAGLVVVDAFDPAAAFIAGRVDVGSNANGIDVVGTTAYLAASDELAVIDVSVASAPVVLGTVPVPGVATDVKVRGGVAYVAAGTAGLVLYDVSTPSAPVELGGVDTLGRARGVDVTDDGLAVVADSQGGVLVIDVSDPSLPNVVGSTHTRPNRRSHAAQVVVRGRRAYVADGADGNLGGLREIDFSRADTPVVAGSTSDVYGLTAVALDGPLALTSDFYFVNAVPIFNVEAVPPAFQALLDFRGPPSFRDDNGHDLAVRDGLVYLVASRGYIGDNFSVGNTGLHIGRYRAFQDLEGIAPTVEITSPETGDSALERRNLIVTADAEDDFRVASVRLMADGVEVELDLAPPFTFSFPVPGDRPSFTLVAEAIDTAGNVGTSLPVTVTVTPDASPVATVLAPAPGNVYTEGTTIQLAVDASDDVAVTQVEILVDGAVQGTLFFPPYVLDYPLSVGAASITVSARVVDDVGQEGTADPVVIPVADDPAPTAVVLEPVAGAEVVEGSILRVLMGAADNSVVDGVTLEVGGSPVGTSATAPYERTLMVPAAPASLVLRATATDDLGQVGTSDPVTVTAIPDPGTTATGRVVRPDGLPAAGASLLCLGVTGTAGADGTFAVAGIASVVPAISCSAIFLAPDGVQARGTSVAVPPAPGAQTVVGDIEVSGQLLYLGGDVNGGPVSVTGSGGGGSGPIALHLHDDIENRAVPWSDPYELGFDALVGLVFTAPDRLLGATRSVAFEVGSDTKVPAKGYGSSELVVLDPDTGSVIDSAGFILADDLPSSPVRGDGGGFEIGVADLAYDPTTATLYGLLSSVYGSRLYTIDPDTAEATTVSDPRTYYTAGLAFGLD